MAIADSGPDYVSAPKDYAELFQRYYTFVVRLVQSRGIDEAVREDVASEILLRFMEVDYLSKFDADLTFTHGGREHAARFKTFLSKVVASYLLGHGDKTRRLASRELLIYDMPLGRTATNYGGDFPTWGAQYGGQAPDHQDDVVDAFDELELCDRIRAYLATVPPRSAADICDLPAVFDAVAAQVREYGCWDMAKLCAHFGVKATAMNSWMWWMRENVAVYLDRPAPVKRTRVVKKKDPS